MSSQTQRRVQLIQPESTQTNKVICRVCNNSFSYSQKHKIFCSTGCRRVGLKERQKENYRKRKPYIPRYCRVCTSSIPESSSRFTLCSDLCAEKAEQVRIKKRAVEKREYLRLQKRNWWLNNKEKHREANRRSKQKRFSKPGTAKREMARYRARKAKVENFIFTLRDERRMLNRQSNRCAYCALSLGEGNMHLDHVVPISKGGRHGPSNLVFACVRCNTSKNNRFVMVWRLAESQRKGERENTMPFK